MSQTRIVILGGGFGGLCVARRLLRCHLRDCIAITIIDQNVESVYTPWLHELAGDISQNSLVRDCEIDLVSIRGIRYRHGVIESIDRVNRHVLCADGMTVPFDILVCALGSVANDFQIPGVGAFAFDLKRASDAVRIHERLSSIILRAKRGKRSRLLVVGAGANGTEFAAEVASAIRSLVQRGVLQKKMIDVVLADSSSAPLMMFSPMLQKRAFRRLAAIGVQCDMGVSLTKLQDGIATFQPIESGIHKGKSYTELFDCCVVTLGVKVPESIHSFSFRTNERGRIFVDSTLRVEGEPAIFALGDCAILNNANGDPQTAQAVIRQSKTVVKNIVALIRSRSLQKYQSKKKWDVIISLGHKYALGSIFGVPVSGYTVSILRRVVDFHYFLLVLPFWEACRRMTKGSQTYAKGDIIETNKNMDPS
ncbi:MAG: FAD-dependent oxidoreductase [Patescibacteria group bacterium]|jgi:NADH dehydrogenase